MTSMTSFNVICMTMILNKPSGDLKMIPKKSSDLCSQKNFTRSSVFTRSSESLWPTEDTQFQ